MLLNDRRSAPESFEQLVARVNGTAYFPPASEDGPAEPAKKHTAPWKKSVKKLLRKLSPGALQLLTERLANGWRIHGGALVKGDQVRLLDGDADHTVKDGACTCPDFKFRGRECKHLRALRLGAATPAHG